MTRQYGQLMRHLQGYRMMFFQHARGGNEAHVRQCFACRTDRNNSPVCCTVFPGREAVRSGRLSGVPLSLLSQLLMFVAGERVGIALLLAV